MPRASRSLVPRCYDDYFPDELERSVIVEKDGVPFVAFCPQEYQLPFYESDCPNLLALGTRGTGKSTQLRWDAIIRCLTYPGFRALIIRRKMPDLRKSHLHFIEAEMKLLGGVFLWTTYEAKFPNGSIIQFSHCETMSDVLNYLSSEWGYIGFDELSTFTLEMFLNISAAARASEAAPYKALVRACSNPLGPGAQWMQQWFINKDVNLGEYPDYLPEEFEMQFSSYEQNVYINRKAYEKRLKLQPDHVRRAWLLGEFVMEGAYFVDFHKRDNDGNAWHVIKTMPTWKGKDISQLPWISIYRAIDWGYFPDPAVCLWIAVFPNKWAVVFKELHWKRTLADEVAKQIKKQSEGMHIVESFCDPTMFVKTGNAPYSIGEIFEQNAVPLTAAQNDRELYGYSIHQYLNTEIDEHPQVQIVEYACPDLIRTIPVMQMDKSDPRKLADGDDHWVVSLAYFCMGQVVPTRDPVEPVSRRWMQPKRAPRNVAAC